MGIRGKEMKITPTETDRLAAQLFAPAGGMRAAWRGERNGVRPVWERLRDGSESTPDAYDADDPATAGQMLAQVEAVRPGQAVSILDRLHLLPVAEEHRFLVLVEHDGAQAVTTGPTRGAALVAAKRALAEAAK